MITLPAPHRTPYRHSAATPPDASLERAVAFGLRMLDAVHSFALQSDLPASGEISLPPVVGSVADQAHLQTVGPLYLASELEAAQLLPAVEMLAGLFVSGGLMLDPGAAGRELETFWQTRHERFMAAERQAFFARLFGAEGGAQLAAQNGRNTEFDLRMIDLTEALYKLEPVTGYGPLPDTTVTLQTAANELASNLISRSGGFGAYAGTEILGAVQTALNILKQHSVQQAVQAQGVWSAVQNISEMYLHKQADVDTHITRGKSGLLVLNWLAQALPSLGGSPGAFVLPDAPVIRAAAAWLEASLSLAEKLQAVSAGTRA